MFRKAALDRLSSPEELDQLMHVTRPRGWLARLGLGVILAAGFVWSLVAVIPTTVSGQGVLTGGTAADPTLHAVVFVSLEDGRRIQPGMPVKVDLAAVRRERFGLARGTVRQVAQVPADQRTMERILGNDAYAQVLAAAGTLITVEVDLLPDPATVSGYAWSSRDGPPIPLKSGMICTGLITISEQSPISLIIP
jgi:hypothetical protein